MGTFLFIPTVFLIFIISTFFRADSIQFNGSELFGHLFTVNTIRFVLGVCAQQIPFGLENRPDMHIDVHCIPDIRQSCRIECVLPSEFTDV